MSEVERRYLGSEVEVRQAPGKQLKIGGYATVFIPRESKNLGGFIERVSPYCFHEARSAGWPDVVCRFNHDTNMLLGTTGAGTLRLSTDSHGLEYEVRCPQTRRDVFELVERGDITHSSFAFRVLGNGDEWTTDQRNFPVRTLNAVELIDVAPVLSPGYPDATAALRSLDAWRSDGRLPPAGRMTDALRLVEARRHVQLVPDNRTEGIAALTSIEHRIHRAQLDESDPFAVRTLTPRQMWEQFEKRYGNAP